MKAEGLLAISVTSFALNMVKAHSYAQKWLMTEIFPMASTVGTSFFVSRSMSVNPDIRIKKEDRIVGVLNNYGEGKLYKDHEFRKFLRMQDKTVMPSLNN